MKRISSWKIVPKWLKMTCLLYLTLLWYHESLCYMLLPWSWPSISTLNELYPDLNIYGQEGSAGDHHNPTVLRILLAADPQIQGMKNEPKGILGSITRWDADRYLRRTFAQAGKHIDPHLVIFLGDLLDEGTITTGSSYEQYAQRFHDLFFLPRAKTIYIPGDNDIGGEGAELVTDENVEQFRSNFPSLGSGFWDKSVELIEVSGLTDVVMLSNVSSIKRPTILLGHLPILRRRPEPVTIQMLEKLKPTLIFSAHNHRASMSSQPITGHAPPRPTSVSSDFSVLDLSPNPARVQEIIVPTCSYRMGVPDMGYGFAVIDLPTNRLFYTILWLPPRYPHLFVELAVTVAFFVLALGGCLIQKYQRSQRGKVRFSM